MRLFVCQRIIKAHGGSLEAWNNGEGGSIFSFTLPADQGDQDLQRLILPIGAKSNSFYF